MSTLSIIASIPFMPQLLRSMYGAGNNRVAVEAFGLQFKNPVGLAAGFDKDGKYIKALSCLGFGFIEVGTVTPKPQQGNPKPRLFRLKKSQALINRMGFNNEGCDALVERLSKLNRGDVIIGANIGKNKVTPNEKAVDDYVYCFEKLFNHVDYFVVNVSSPNTPDLRQLQDKEPLTKLLSTIQKLNLEKAAPKPVLLKIAPDLSDGHLKDIVGIVQESGIAGIIATNTTIGREGLEESNQRVTEIGAGGLSGAPVRSRSTTVIEFIHQESKGTIPVIGVGGIFNSAHAREKLEAGAQLVQLFTGFIYEGPGSVRKILRNL